VLSLYSIFSLTGNRNNFATLSNICEISLANPLLFRCYRGICSYLCPLSRLPLPCLHFHHFLSIARCARHVSGATVSSQRRRRRRWALSWIRSPRDRCVPRLESSSRDVTQNAKRNSR